MDNSGVDTTMELNRLELIAEDLEATHMWLDVQDVPRKQGDNEYSLVGRIIWYKENDY